MYNGEILINIVLQNAIQYCIMDLRKVVLMMATKTRIESDVKEEAEAILEKLGVSVSSFIDMTYRQVILRNGIPFPVTMPPMPRTRDSMSDAEFNARMGNGLRQAKVGESLAADEAFDRILGSLE